MKTREGIFDYCVHGSLIIPQVVAFEAAAAKPACLSCKLSLYSVVFFGSTPPNIFPVYLAENI